MIEAKVLLLKCLKLWNLIISIYWLLIAAAFVLFVDFVARYRSALKIFAIDIWCLVEASCIVSKTAGIASGRTVEKFRQDCAPVRPRSHSQILPISSSFDLQHTTGLSTYNEWGSTEMELTLLLHITICYLSAVSSVDARIGLRTSPRRTTGDVGGIRLDETRTVRQQLSWGKEARKWRRAVYVVSSVEISPSR